MRFLIVVLIDDAQVVTVVELESGTREPELGGAEMFEIISGCLGASTYFLFAPARHVTSF